MPFRVEFRIMSAVSLSNFAQEFIIRLFFAGVVADLPKQKTANWVPLKERVEEPLYFLGSPDKLSLIAGSNNLRSRMRDITSETLIGIVDHIPTPCYRVTLLPPRTQFNDSLRIALSPKITIGPGAPRVAKTFLSVARRG